MHYTFYIINTAYLSLVKLDCYYRYCLLMSKLTVKFSLCLLLSYNTFVDQENLDYYLHPQSGLIYNFSLCILPFISFILPS